MSDQRSTATTQRNRDACERYRPCTKHPYCKACDLCGLNAVHHGPVSDNGSTPTGGQS